MVRCDRQRTSIDPRRGLYAGIALIGIGMGLAVGPGVAAASPSGSSGSSDTTSESSDTTGGASDNTASDDPSEDSSDRTDDRDTDTEPESSTDTEDAEESATVNETETAADTGAGDTTADASDTDFAQLTAEDEPVRQPRESSQPALDDPAADEPSTATARRSATADAEPVEAGTPAAEPQLITSDTTESAVAATEPAPPAASPGTPSLRRLVSARPVTVDSIVTDLLTWAGLGPLADGLPVPTTPVSALVESLWLAVRQTQYTFNNQRPTAEATISGPGPDGVVTGSLNAVDYDDASLSYSVSFGPQHGSVAIDALGQFTYTPDPGTTLRGDRFTVTVDDTAGNPFHIHGLRGLLGLTGPTRVTVVVAPAHGAQTDPASIDLSGLAASDGVEVTTDATGVVSVIYGRFTDQLVTSTADAAAVLNGLAPALGAAAGFADPSNITTAQAGVGRSVENFYRLGETVGGVRVLGSEVILVTDAAGAVTGLVNNYRGLAEGFDVTPDSVVDEEAEVWLIAGTAYLGSGAQRQSLESLLSQSTFTTQLVVYALDDDAAPSLAWRVVMQLPDTADMSQAGATYVIDADGGDAGRVIVTLSNVQDYTVVSVAEDWLGEQRAITVNVTGVLWNKRYTMVDAVRNITTYKTSFTMFGFGAPVLPGTTVKRGWFGWDRGAVSAHANTAVVYDFYDDVLGRTSFDGQGALVEVSIRYNPGYSSSGYANAFWDPSRQQFAFGDSGYLQAALDVVGHEFTHAVVSYVVGDGGSVLDYGESGALNEAYADILGALIEGKSGQDRWLIGEDSDYGIVRNLANPGAVVTTLGPYRSHYAQRYTGNGDDGGEHINSTIFGHAAYKMMTATATAGVSDETWARVFYQSLFRLSPGAVFTDGRAAVLSAATALGFTAAELGAIRDAFDAVGIVGAAASSAIAA